MATLAVGDTVMAQCPGWGDAWFPGTVRAMFPNGCAEVLWQSERSNTYVAIKIVFNHFPKTSMYCFLMTTCWLSKNWLLHVLSYHLYNNDIPCWLNTTYCHVPQHCLHKPRVILPPCDTLATITPEPAGVIQHQPASKSTKRPRNEEETQCGHSNQKLKKVSKAMATALKHGPVDAHGWMELNDLRRRIKMHASFEQLRKAASFADDKGSRCKFQMQVWHGSSYIRVARWASVWLVAVSLLHSA